MSIETANHSLLEQAKRLATPATALLAGMAMLGAAEEADAYRTPLQVPTKEGVPALNMRFNPGTGKTVCDVEMFSDYQEFTHGPLVLTRIEQWDARTRKWNDNPSFKQPFAEGPQQKDQHTSKTTLETIYNTARLRRTDKNAPARVTCYGGGKDISLQIRFKHPLKKQR